MMLMQEASQSSFDLVFPKEYLQRLEEYRKRQVEILSKRRRVRKAPSAPKGFSDNCKQATSLANKTYCCVLKEFVEGALCTACPCYEQEPLEYSLFRRV